MPDTYLPTSPQSRFQLLKFFSHLLLATTISILLLSACSQNTRDAETVGNSLPASEFEIELFGNENHQSGEILRLADLKGKAVIINFWYPSCPPCREEIPYFESAYQQYKNLGVEFIGVQNLGLDTIQDGQLFIDEYAVTYAVGADATGEIVVDYKIIGFPSTVFLDRNHHIVRHWTGGLDLEKLVSLVQTTLE